MSAGQRLRRTALILALAGGGAAALLASLQLVGCGNGCGRARTTFYFHRADYYIWAWKGSGGTLVIGGKTPTSESDVRNSVFELAPGCPTPEEAYRYAQDPSETPDLRVVCAVVESSERRPGAGDCFYSCAYDYCPSDG